MKIKTQDLIGPALDWAVAKAEGSLDEAFKVGDALTNRVVLEHGVACFDMRSGRMFRPSTDWSQGGPIIDRLKPRMNSYEVPAGTFSVRHEWGVQTVRGPSFSRAEFRHESLLIAAMRCYVASKLGDEVDMPEELMS